jgi:hypothetical protein
MWPSPAGEVNNTLLPMRAILPLALTTQADEVGAVAVDHAFAVDAPGCRVGIRRLKKSLATVAIDTFMTELSASPERCRSSLPAPSRRSAQNALCQTFGYFSPGRTRAYRDERADALRRRWPPGTLGEEIVSSPSSPNGNDL